MLSNKGALTLRAALMFAITIALMGPSLTQPVDAQAQYQANYNLRMPHYFDETGFWVQGPFREYWESHGGLYIFGYPITGVFLDNGLYKQYFERAIFEYHPEHAGTEYEVLLQRLGAIRTEGRENEVPFQPMDVEPDANCDVHDATGHRLCFGFRDYWNLNGGLSNFGFAISEEFQEQNAQPPAGDGQTYTVQYFERARFEWHPEHRGTQFEYLLGLLGTEYLEQHGAPESALSREARDMPPADPTTGLRYGPHVGYGFNIAWRGDDAQAPAFHQQTLDKINESGFGWIRIQVGWDSAEATQGQYYFTHIDRLVDLARANNVRVLVSVLKAPHWATGDGTDGIPANTEPFQAFMSALASHFSGRIDAYEIWNEQNLAYETGGNVDIGRYVNILKAGYNGVKAADPNAFVLFGGLTPTGVDLPSLAVDDVLYLERVYAHNGGEVKQYYDVLGAHPGSNGNAPDYSWPNNPNSGEWTTHNSFYFQRVAELRGVMERHGEGHKQVWLTEFGWTTANPAGGYEYGALNSEQEQADYLVRAFQIAKQDWPWMGVMFVWNLNFATVVGPEDEKGPWSVLNSDWSNRPSFEALKQMPK